MKLTRFLLLPAILVFSCTAAWAQSQPGYATIVRMTGEARFSADNGATWKPLVVGQALGAGNILQTANDSTVDLVLGQKISRHIDTIPTVAPTADASVRGLASYRSQAEQNVIHLKPGTVLAIDKLTAANTGVDAVSDTELDLRKGGIFGNVKKLSATSQYLIKMPNGIAGVRGTSFTIDVDPRTFNAIVAVLFGSVVLSEIQNGQTVTEVVHAGQGLNVLGQIFNLSPQQTSQLRALLTFTVTIENGFLTLANDKTTIYVSATTGVMK